MYSRFMRAYIHSIINSRFSGLRGLFGPVKCPHFIIQMSFKVKSACIMYAYNIQRSEFIISKQTFNNINSHIDESRFFMFTVNDVICLLSYYRIHKLLWLHMCNYAVRIKMKSDARLPSTVGLLPSHYKMNWKLFK